METIIAISAIAWIVLIISNEVIGHGCAAYLNGGKQTALHLLAGHKPPL